VEQHGRLGLQDVLADAVTLLMDEYTNACCLMRKGYIHRRLLLLLLVMQET